MAPHKKNIIERTKQFKRALVLQDTTGLNYSGQKRNRASVPDDMKMSGICLFTLNGYK